MKSEAAVSSGSFAVHHVNYMRSHTEDLNFIFISASTSVSQRKCTFSSYVFDRRNTSSSGTFTHLKCFSITMIDYFVCLQILRSEK